MSDKHVTFSLMGIDMNTTANINDKPSIALSERDFIEHVMRRTLFSVFSRMAMIAKRNPDGLIEDLQDMDNIKDNAVMWAKHVSVEMEIDGLFEHDKLIMHKICGKDD
jgi:hypothetical protein